MSEDTQEKTGKIAHLSGFIGQEGINLIATTVGRMRHLWTPTTGQSDVGIDGYIELCRDDEGARRVATNFIIQVQSRATNGSWPHEDDTGFVFKVDERDLEHWLAGNHPVILIVSRPRTGEAYWIPIKEYFSTLEAKQTREIYFKKHLHRFDEKVDLALKNLAIPSNAGFRTDPVRKPEGIDSNLIPLLHYPTFIYSAKTRFRSIVNIKERAKELHGELGREWFCKGGRIISFRPLNSDPWPKITVGKPLPPINTIEWANTDDADIQRDFVRLLNETVAGFLATRGLWRFRIRRRKVLYYFSPNAEHIERKVIWGERDSERTVVQKVMAKGNPSRVVCYRHHAIIPSFERFGGKWFLAIEPTYYFTVDGEKEYRFREEYLAGLKRLEKHQAVSNNLRFWTYFMTHKDLFDKRQDLLAFGSSVQFQANFGIPDSDWLSSADDKEREQLGGLVEEGTSEKLFADSDQLSLTYET